MDGRLTTAVVYVEMKERTFSAQLDNGQALLQAI